MGRIYDMVLHIIMTMNQLKQRRHSLTSFGAFFNAAFVLLLCFNLIQNHVYFHQGAMRQSERQLKGDHYFMPPPVGSSAEGEGGSSPISMTIPRGKAVALPSVIISKEEEKNVNREIYGGKGDKPHLGGFTEFDPMGVSPSLWKYMVSYLGIKSLLDVGCGRGISTSWFVTHGLEFVQCVEGSHDAVMQSIIPNSTEHVVEHDFSRGPWWPDRTVDAVWSVEFTEHVGRNFQPNYITAFRKAALIFVTHSVWGGWHHVEVHLEDWWRVRWEAAGFVYSQHLTESAKNVAYADFELNNLTSSMKAEPNKTYSVGQHIWSNIQVFINPMVASLPEHAHLFAEHGCFGGEIGTTVDCSIPHKEGHMVTPLPDSFKPLILTDEMDAMWLELIKDCKV